MYVPIRHIYEHGDADDIGGIVHFFFIKKRCSAYQNRLEHAVWINEFIPLLQLVELLYYGLIRRKSNIVNRGLECFFYGQRES